MPHPIFENILKTYCLHAHLLSQTKSNHFFLRAYSATGDSQFIEPCRQIIPAKIKNIPLLLKAIDTLNPSFEPKDFLGESINVLRNKKRQQYYSQHPLLPIFHDLVNDLFVLKRLHAVHPWKKMFIQGCNTLSLHKDQAELLCTQDAIKDVSSYSANVIYHLNSLGIFDLISPYLHTLESLLVRDYSDPQKLSPSDLYSVYYTLTHVIIAASDYYDHPPVGNFSFIFDFFENHTELILNQLSLDILTEIALCYRLCGQNSKTREKIQAHIEKYFSLDPYGSSSELSKKEHTASLLLLLFSPIEKFVSGPRLY